MSNSKMQSAVDLRHLNTFPERKEESKVAVSPVKRKVAESPAKPSLQIKKSLQNKTSKLLPPTQTLTHFLSKQNAKTVSKSLSQQEQQFSKFESSKRSTNNLLYKKRANTCTNTINRVNNISNKLCLFIKTCTINSTYKFIRKIS